jgi:hypothetical protein
MDTHTNHISFGAAWSGNPPALNLVALVWPELAMSDTLNLQEGRVFMSGFYKFLFYVTLVYLAIECILLPNFYLFIIRDLVFHGLLLFFSNSSRSDQAF